MFQFDYAFLKSLDLDSMPDEDQQSLLEHIYKELELRVGVRLSEGMSDKSLNEFAKINSVNSQAALQWLENNRPNFKDIVSEELKKLCQEVQAGRNKILGLEEASA